jgi:hypothetical protein
MKKQGIIIFALGLIFTVFTSFKFFTREKIVDIGNLKISANKEHDIAWSPYIGIAAMAVGSMMFLYERKK